VTFGNCFIDGTILEAQANRHTAVWRKNLDRYEQGQKEKVLQIARAINVQAAVEGHNRCGCFCESQQRDKPQDVFGTP
jgi:hypothetical protein